MRRDALYSVLALAVLAISAVPIGSAVFLLGFVYGDSPCVMCWEQRIGMALIALIGLFILRYGPKPTYIGLGVLVGSWGLFMGMRHVGMHAARDVGQGFSLEILGAHTYTWALFIYWMCVVTMGALLLGTRREDLDDGPRPLRPLGATAGVVFLVVIAGNLVQAFASTGPPPFMGQSDPVRFSFNPTHWVWSTEEWSVAPLSLRGRWSIAKPTVAGLPTDPATGPFAALPALAVTSRRPLGLTLVGTPTDLAYDPDTDRFLLTTQHGVYLVDGSLARVTRYTVVDPGFSVDLGQFAGGAFLDRGQIMAVGENKSYVVLKASDTANRDENFRFFLESFDAFEEVARSRLGTVRARMMYTMSLAFDPATGSIYTVSVPNQKAHTLVVSRFDGRDRLLSEEFMPTLAPGSGVRLAGRRSLDELFVTGAAIANGRMYALSAAYDTLVTIDLAAHAVVAAYAIPGLVRPTGLALKGDELYIVDEQSRLTVVSRPAADR